VPAQAHATDSCQADVDELLPLALSRPREALARAQAVLATRPGPYDASVAHQAAGIVLREFGDVAASVRELRRALRRARQSGSDEREVDVLASLGVALVYAGHTANGLAAFDQAVRRSTGVLAARVLHRRAAALWAIGRFPAALEDLRRAVSVLGRAGDPVWAARALTARGLVNLSIGFPDRADADFVAAGRLFAETRQELEAVYVVQNRALVAFGSGNIPAALSFLDEATARLRLHGVPLPPLSTDRCSVLLAAGLVGDALTEADAAVRNSEHVRRRGELLLMAANCALAASRPQMALDWAQTALRLFRSQQSSWWKAQAALVVAQARHGTGVVSAPLVHEASRAAARLESLGASEAVNAHLLAGKVALELGRRGDAHRHFTAAARYRPRGPALSRARGWLGAALQAEAMGNSRALFAACRRGLEIMEEHRFSLGASELRAQATAHGAELSALAQSRAARAHRPRVLLAWSERGRATALAVPAVRPSADPELNAGLAALRGVTIGLEKAQSQGLPTGILRKEQLRLEGVVRTRSLQARGGGGRGRAVIDVAELLDQLGGTLLLEIVDVDGVLHVLVCGAGRVRQLTAGRTEDAVRAAEFARFALRRLAHSRPGDDPDSMLAMLKAAGSDLQAAIIGPAADHLGDRPVVVVPPGKLHTIPWALLPALGDRTFSVAPSAGAWMRADAAAPPSRRHVTLARGPGLVTDGAEVPLVAELYDEVTVLSDSDATAGRVLSALDGAWLAHIAAHGRFRADSPLFSSLRMHDGPLTVYDFEQLHRAPYRLVLSSCDSGVLAPAGADELLGLISSLLPLGTAGIIAGVVPLNDHAVVPLMVTLHRYLRAGHSLAESMLSVRQDVDADPIQQGAAMSLLALGAG
jgi:tetratricopeptide (TPR) repeat protein